MQRYQPQRSVNEALVQLLDPFDALIGVSSHHVSRRGNRGGCREEGDNHDAARGIVADVTRSSLRQCIAHVAQSLTRTAHEVAEPGIPGSDQAP